jgi:hypothetical protein
MYYETMETLEGQEAPSPLDVIEEFEATNTQLIESAGLAIESPSISTLGKFMYLMDSAGDYSALFLKQEFYRGTSSPLITAHAVRSMVDALEKLAPGITSLNPAYEVKVIFNEETRAAALDALLKKDDEDDEAEGMVATNIVESDETKVSTEVIDTPAKMTEFLCRSYKYLLDTMNSAVLGSASVQEFTELLEKRKHRKERFMNLGAVGVTALAASYIGTRLAQKHN